jgi:hypothetical protein
VTVVIEDDGTVVDDEKFFKKLPAQTVFVFLRLLVTNRLCDTYYASATGPCHYPRK